MELKPGYKQTEVGVIPNEWEVEPLGSVGHWFSGGTPSMANDLFWSGEIPWVSAKDMKVARLRDSLLHVTEKAIGNGTRLAPRGAVLMVVRGMILAHTLPVAVATRPVAFNQDMKALVARAGIDSEFILLWLQSNAQRVLAIASEATHGTKRIPSEDLFSMKIALPPPPEQRVIAGALSDVDALIGALDQLIAKKRDLKQAAMQQLLTGQKRLPGFHGEWEVKRLGELGSTYGGLTGKTKSDFGEGSALYITFMNIMTNVVVDSDTFERVKVLPTEAQNKVMKGDLFFNGSSETPEEVGMCAVLLDDLQKVFLNSFCFGYRFREGAETDGLYLAYYFRSSEGRELLYSLAQGATRYNLSKRSLLRLKFPLPLLPEQTAIAEVLSDMDAELAALEQRRDKTRALKQGMMQELLTGRTRLV